MNRIHALLLNPDANSGGALQRWKKLLASDAADRMGLKSADIYDGAQGLDGLPTWVSERIQRGARNFAAAGGDGTVNVLLSTLMRAPERQALSNGELRLGAIGLGSSNDFQKPFFASGREFVSGVHCRIDFPQASAHDVGQLEYDNSWVQETRYFIVNASVGVTAEANWEFNQAGRGLSHLKRHWIDGAIVATALKTFASYHSFKARISLDNGAEQEIDLTNLGVVKNVHFSGQMHYDLPQLKDDGRFGVHLCEGMSRFEMLKILHALSSGQFSGFPKTSSTQASRVTVEAESLFAIETDGEVVRSRRACFETLPRELFVCP